MADTESIHIGTMPLLVIVDLYEHLLKYPQGTFWEERKLVIENILCEKTAKYIRHEDGKTIIERRFSEIHKAEELEDLQAACKFFRIKSKMSGEARDLQESNQRLLDILIQKNIEIDTLKSKKDGKSGS